MIEIVAEIELERRDSKIEPFMTCKLWYSLVNSIC